MRNIKDVHFKIEFDDGSVVDYKDLQEDERQAFIQLMRRASLSAWIDEFKNYPIKSDEEILKEVVQSFSEAQVNKNINK